MSIGMDVEYMQDGLGYRSLDGGGRGYWIGVEIEEICGFGVRYCDKINGVWTFDRCGVSVSLKKNIVSVGFRLCD